MTQLKETISRTSSTLAQDFAGATALVVILVIGLNLPELI